MKFNKIIFLDFFPLLSTHAKNKKNPKINPYEYCSLIND